MVCVSLHALAIIADDILINPCDGDGVTGTGRCVVGLGYVEQSSCHFTISFRIQSGGEGDVVVGQRRGGRGVLRVREGDEREVDRNASPGLLYFTFYIWREEYVYIFISKLYTTISPIDQSNLSSLVEDKVGFRISFPSSTPAINVKVTQKG